MYERMSSFGRLLPALLNNSKMFMRKLNHVSEEYPLLFDGLSLNWSLLEAIFCQIKHAVLKL